jgi:hypothetical protein
MGTLGTLVVALVFSRTEELSAMVDYPAEWRRLAQEFYDIPDPQENLRAFKSEKDGRWQLMGGIGSEHDPARIQYRYETLAKHAAALARRREASLQEWLEFVATEGPAHETRSGGTDPPRLGGVVLHPHIPAIEGLRKTTVDFCRDLEARAFAEAVGITAKSEEGEPSRPASVANAETRSAPARSDEECNVTGAATNFTWSDVETYFDHEHMAQIKIAGKSHNANYSEMGFADRRGRGKNNPTEAWWLLQEVAWARGELNMAKYGKLRGRALARMSTLNKTLQKYFSKFFPANTPPIYFEKRRGHIARFGKIDANLSEGPFLKTRRM